MIVKRGLFIGLIVLVVLSILPPVAAQESETMWPTAGWSTSTPEAQGVDSAKLAEYLKKSAGGQGFHSLLVIRHGYVILDASLYPFSASEPHALYSTTKSLTSTVAGVAYTQGYIENADQSIWDFFSQEGTANWEERKAALTIKDLMTQSSGLSILIKDDIGMYMLGENDQAWDQFVLDRPMYATPGTIFAYTDANAHLVSALITRATGMSADEFARPRLFEPLGINSVTWVPDPQGSSRGGDHSYMNIYDLAKLGYLYLHHGEWDGQQIVAADWIEQATSKTITGGYVDGYGYFWHCGELVGGGNKHWSYLAIGLGGQELWVIPDLDLIVAITGDGGYMGLGMIRGYLLKAVSPDSASLPENAEAFAQLQAQIDTLAHPIPAEIPALDENAQRISGKTFVLEDNTLGWQSFALTFQDQGASFTLDTGPRQLELPVGLDDVWRVSSEGMAPDTVWWPLDNIPLALKGEWQRNGKFVLFMRDLRGMLDFRIEFEFDGDNANVKVVANLPAFSLIWGNNRTDFTGTMQ